MPCQHSIKRIKGRLVIARRDKGVPVVISRASAINPTRKGDYMFNRTQDHTLRRRILGTVAALGAAPLLVLASGSLSKAQEASGKPLVIGAVIAKTGFMAQYDEPALATAVYAIEDLNQGKLAILGTSEPGLLGRSVKLIVRDYRTDRELAPSVAQEVIDEGAEFLIASCDFDFGSPAALVAQDEGIVSISLCAGSPRFGPEGGLELGFSAGSVAESSAAAAAEWAYKTKGWKTAYLLNDPGIQVDTDWSLGFDARFTELAGANSIVDKDTFQNDDANINSQVNAIRQLSSQPDVIVITSYPPGGARAVRQIRASGITIPLILNDAMDGNSWWDTVPVEDRTEIYVATNGHYLGEDERPEVNALVERYKRETGELPPSSLFLDGYGLIEVLALAATRAGTTDGQAVKEELEKFRGVKRIGGPATFTETLHDAPDRKLAILKLEGTGATLVELRAPCRIPKYADIVNNC